MVRVLFFCASSQSELSGKTSEDSVADTPEIKRDNYRELRHACNSIMLVIMSM